MALAGAVVSKPMAKSTTCAIGVLPGDLQGVERRVDHPHVGAGRLERAADRCAVPGTRSMSPNEQNIDIRPRRQGMRAIDHLQRGHADRAARAVQQLDPRRQQAVDARI